MYKIKNYVVHCQCILHIRQMQGEVYHRDTSHLVTGLKLVLQPIHSVPKTTLVLSAACLGLFFLGWALFENINNLRIYEDGLFIAASMGLAVGICAVDKMGMR